MNIRRPFVIGFVAALAVVLMPATALAHVTVKPNQVNIAAFQTFTTGVPNEKDVPVTAVRLVIPSGLQHVTPTVKAGWQITTKKSGDTISEITWSGGSVPAGFREEFSFSGQVPNTATSLQWKAYQTYGDGSVVAWDQAPSTDTGDDKSSDKGPYSTTEVIDDLADSSASDTNVTSNQTVPYVLSLAAFILSIIALVIRRK